MSSAEVIRCLRNLLATHGIPDKIIPDNGTAFVFDEIKNFFKENGISYNMRAPYHPASNSQAERMVQHTKTVLSQLEGELTLRLARFLFRQHTTPHAVTRKTPAEILMGRRLRTAMDKLHPDSIATDQPSAEPVGASRAFNVRDEAYVRNYNHGLKWLPAKIIEVTGPVSYITETMRGEIARRHVDQIIKRTGNQIMAKELKVVISNPERQQAGLAENLDSQKEIPSCTPGAENGKTVTTRVSTLNRKWNQVTIR